MSTILNYILTVAEWCFFFSILYLPLRTLMINKDTTLSHEAGLWLFHLALLTVITQTLTADGTVTGMTYSLDYLTDSDLISLEPFRIISRVTGIADPGARLTFALVNVAGNILIFVPVGFCAGWYFRMKIWQATLVGAGLSLFVELFQRFLPRTTDIDDLIMNTFGALLGALLFAAVAALLKKQDEKRPDLG